MLELISIEIAQEQVLEGLEDDPNFWNSDTDEENEIAAPRRAPTSDGTRSLPTY